ncbi:MAG: glutamine amidotransferase [Myxococcales bacterium]|nr:glutamine amidotransferase [Myxococcales bacterium]MCB9525673.1 glutamine amidotransferase [Myxococcales bacterium]
MKPIILVTGHNQPDVVAARGDFEHWFAAASGLPLERFEVVDGTLPDVRFPQPGNVDGLIITGSAARVHDHEPWSVRCGQWSAQVLAAGAPVLGVCYGHQLLGDVLGGAVGPNPNGREIGVFEVEMAEDPLFEGLPRRFPTLLSHLDAVNTPPPGARVLGHSALTPNQGMALGENGRTVQFHPEFDDDVVRRYLTARREIIDEEAGAGTTDRLLAALRPVHTGQVILRNFLRHWVGLDV